MASKYLMGNVHDKGSPPSVFKKWLAGPFPAWAAKETGERGVEMRAKAEEFSQLSTDGTRENVEFKYSNFSKVTTSEQGRNDPTGVNTLVVFMSGQMNIELVAWKTGERFPLVLKREGDYLAWASSVYNHSWKAGPNTMCVTLRWSEKVLVGS
jgi:hypothetical protein